MNDANDTVYAEKSAACSVSVNANHRSEETVLKALIQDQIVNHTDHQIYISAEEIADEVSYRPSGQEWPVCTP